MAIPPLRRVALVGGTHGNENNGIFLVNHYRRGDNMSELRRPSFESVQVILGNPAAYKTRQRFVDEDMNRAFTVERLRDWTNPGYESARAKALNALLGPKPGSLDPPGSPIPKGQVCVHRSRFSTGASVACSSACAVVGGRCAGWRRTSARSIL